MTDVSDTVRVLHVDDDGAFVEMAAQFLERESDDLVVETATDAAEALDRLAETDVDCVVSDYDMPRMNGLALLESVRESHPDLPFILFTGKGNEEIASEAISAGVTDYLQKDVGTDQYAVLANRIRNLVAQRDAEEAVERTRQRFQRLVEASTDVISIVNADATFEYVTPSAERVLGYDPEEMVGRSIFEFAHPDDRAEAMEKFYEAVEDPERRPLVRFRFKDKDGNWPVLESRGRNLLEDPVVGGFVVNSRDISELVEREAALERKNERLEEFASVLSHDLRNPLEVVGSHLELYRETGDESHLDAAEDAQERMARIIDNLLRLARYDREAVEREPVDLAACCADQWDEIGDEESRLDVDVDRTVSADPGMLRQLLGNLFRNAIDHNPDPVTVRVGALDDGFFVEDDGRGIPPGEHDDVFEFGYTTTEAGHGFGLRSVEQIATAHGWTVRLSEGPEGGARFEVRGVGTHDPE